MFDPNELSEKGLTRVALALGGYSQRAFRIRMYKIFEGDAPHPVLRETTAMRWNLDMPVDAILAQGPALYRVLRESQDKVVELRKRAMAEEDEDKVREIYDEIRELAVQAAAAKDLMERISNA